MLRQLKNLEQLVCVRHRRSEFWCCGVAKEQLRARSEVFSQAYTGFNGGAGHGSTTKINDSANNALSAVQLDMKRLGCWLNLGSRYVGEEKK